MALQIDIVKQVMSLGAGGGFYTPRFQEREMRLQMFCLGRHWDTRRHVYSSTRADHDGLAVLPLPSNLVELSQGVLSDLEQKSGRSFPKMRPDTCIANLYNESGSLGLHEDCDESKASIEAGIPVVSMSFGCSARFLYEDAHDVRSALLRSGDMVVFGGANRRLRHGLSKVFPNTAPKRLKEIIGATRLNLTFRQTI